MSWECWQNTPQISSGNYVAWIPDQQLRNLFRPKIFQFLIDRDFRYFNTNRELQQLNNWYKKISSGVCSDSGSSILGRLKLGDWLSSKTCIHHHNNSSTRNWGLEIGPMMRKFRLVYLDSWTKLLKCPCFLQFLVGFNIPYN